MASFTLKAVTAPGELFESREALAAHYSSPLHLYNLKRKNGGMRLVTREEFEKRVEAAKQMKEENEAAQLREGRGHLKNKDEVDSSSASSTNTTSITNKPQHDIDDDADPADMTIDPSSSLFDPTTHTTCQLALDHMQTTNNFTLPFSEQIIDLEGLLGYLHEKVKLGHMCLECERVFRSVRGCRDHMKAERHQRVANKGWDETEFGCFYDFDIGKEKGASTINIAEGNEVENDDDEVDIDSDDDSYYDEYQRNLAANGYQINTFGELELANGKIIGHRGLKKFYAQRFSTKEDTAAVHLAKVNNAEKGTQSSWERMRREGGASGGGVGRHGGGILALSNNGSGGITNGAISAVSLYRFRAIVKKARRVETIQRMYLDRKFNNTNRMDKKANRLMNGVSVAHAKR